MLRIQLVPANAVNMITVINANMLDNYRAGRPAQLELPNLVARALLVHYESGIMPVTDSKATV